MSYGQEAFDRKDSYIDAGLGSGGDIGGKQRYHTRQHPKKGYRVVIDPGHGGSDCGAVGVSGVKEAGLNLAVSLYLKEELEALGMEAILTRSDERALAEGKKADMAARGKIMNGEGVDLVVSVHMNKFTDPSIHGPMAFYMKGSAEGEKLAKTVIDSITDELGARGA